ncbi:putative mitochondrial protein [Cinnamomum micranthum f. kanehirae]|uniref:Putative mitochondrial protein n=1 Tax=Cinnamomum micranthum f. kanehirae TaxID=337451 RepID=A0A443Q5C3_9MAGN|nr:putative mitochondrial protein [Cinnamomum micranthum f. kanehirae]
MIGRPWIDPMDGTYDQCKPLARLLGVNNEFSFDLKAATASYAFWKDVNRCIRLRCCSCLAHHNTVWLSAELVDPGSRFTAYAILGDDIVIGDAEVAAMYQKVVAIAKIQYDIKFPTSNYDLWAGTAITSDTRLSIYNSRLDCRLAATARDIHHKRRQTCRPENYVRIGACNLLLQERRPAANLITCDPREDQKERAPMQSLKHRCQGLRIAIETLKV